MVKNFIRKPNVKGKKYFLGIQFDESSHLLSFNEASQTQDPEDNHSIVTHISDYDFSELSDYEE